MSSEDWRRLSLLALVLGLMFLVSGLVTWFYTETAEVGLVRIPERHPYRDYGLPLLILGVCGLLIGLLSFRFAEEERRREVEAGKQRP